MKTYTFEVPALAEFKVEAESEREAIRKARAAHVVVMAEQDNGFPFGVSPTRAEVNGVRLWLTHDQPSGEDIQNVE